MKHPERIEDNLEHIAEAIDRITTYIQEIGNVASLEHDHQTQADRDHRRGREQNSQTSGGIRFRASFATVERNAGHAQQNDPQLFRHQHGRPLEHSQGRPATTETAG
jgi:hypothetical protein